MIEKCLSGITSFFRSLPVTYSPPGAQAIVNLREPFLEPFLEPLFHTEQFNSDITMTIHAIIAGSGWFGLYYKQEDGGGRTYLPRRGWVDISGVYT